MFRCGTNHNKLTVVDAQRAKTLLLGAKYDAPLQKRQPHRLCRDNAGKYYYVEKGFPGAVDEKHFKPVGDPVPVVDGKTVEFMYTRPLYFPPVKSGKSCGLPPSART